VSICLIASRRSTCTWKTDKFPYPLRRLIRYFDLVSDIPLHLHRTRMTKLEYSSCFKYEKSEGTYEVEKINYVSCRRLCKVRFMLFLISGRMYSYYYLGRRLCQSQPLWCAVGPTYMYFFEKELYCLFRHLLQKESSTRLPSFPLCVQSLALSTRSQFLWCSLVDGSIHLLASHTPTLRVPPRSIHQYGNISYQVV
jgi:hypothetical protein